MSIRTKLPVIFFDGNCQGQHISAVLQWSQLAETYAVGSDLGFVPGYKGQSCRYIQENDVEAAIRKAKSEGRTVLQASQSTMMADDRKMSYSGLVDGLIRYPHLQSFCLSPGEFASQFGRTVAPERSYELDLKTIATCQKRSATKVDFAGFVDAHFRRRSLFHTALHPAGELTGLLFESVATQLPDADPQVISLVKQGFMVGEGMNFTTFHPVPDDLLRALKFDWGTSYQNYRQLLVLAAGQKWRECYDLALATEDLFSADTQYWWARLRSAENLGQLDDARASVRRLLDLCKGFIHYWLAAFRLFAKDYRTLVRLIGEAHDFYSGQRQHSMLMAYHYLFINDFTSAETYARNYHTSTPDRADALVPILKVFCATARRAEGQGWVKVTVEHCTSKFLGELKQNLSLVPEIDLSHETLDQWFAASH